MKLLAFLLLAILAMAVAARAAGVRDTRMARMMAREDDADTADEESSEDAADEGSEDAADESSEESSDATPLKGGCQNDDSCQSVKIVGQNGEGSSAASSVDDAVAPVAEWLKDFKKRAQGSGDIASAAEAMAKPVVERLKAKQDAMIEQLQQSNQDILNHVSRSVTEHALKLLRTDALQAKEESEALDKKEAKVEAAAEVEAAKEKAKAVKAEA